MLDLIVVLDTECFFFSVDVFSYQPCCITKVVFIKWYLWL